MLISVLGEWRTIGSGSFAALSRDGTVNGFLVNSAAAEGRMAAAQVLTPGRRSRFFAQPFGEIRAGPPEIYALLMEVKRFCGKGAAILAAAGPLWSGAGTATICGGEQSGISAIRPILSPFVPDLVQGLIAGRRQERKWSGSGQGEAGVPIGARAHRANPATRIFTHS